MTTKYLIIFLLLFNSLWALASDRKVPKLVVISDVDDTIKVSNVRDSIERVAYSVFNDSLFYGMDLVYRSLHTPNTEFFYLSNGWRPTVEESHQAILNDFNFPSPENYIPRNLKQIIKKEAHKKLRIAEIVKKARPDILILIGDNGEKDPQIYHDMTQKLQEDKKTQNSSLKIFTFIHTVYKPDHENALFPEQVDFATAAELAALLNEKNILPLDKALNVVKNVTQKIHSEAKKGVYGPLVYPYFKHRLTTKEFHRRQCKRIYQRSPFASYLNHTIPMN